MRLRDPIPLDRTFAVYGETEGSDSESDVERHFRERYTPKITWSHLLQHRAVVILGERGLGKTIELRAQAALLEKSGKNGFFIPLYRITDRDQLRLIFGSLGQGYDRWRASNEHAFFFLDSIDESRLLGLGAFERALALVAEEIGAASNRTSIFISSRFADWNLTRVQEAIEAHVVRPMGASQAGTTVAPQIFRLQRLSATDAKRLAAAHRVESADDFWQAVIRGGYEFLATRPLDLEWMAAQWVSTRRLGSYTELLEASIANRLTETNEIYIDAGALVSPWDLREMAEQLAAVCSFSGRPFIELGGAAGTADTVSASEALPEKTRTHCNRLLHSALFHEASFGQLQFSHRTLREYLAACWLKRRLDAGLPPTQALRLFVERPFGQTVLVHSRRALLSWLASMNPSLCERVARSFPELLFFEGDPARWGAGVLLKALDAYLLKVKAGYQPDWHSDASDVCRLARALPPGALAQRIEEHQEHRPVLIRLLALVQQGEVHDAAPVVMQLYSQAGTDEQIRCAALLALGWIGTREMRVAIAHDLVSGEIEGVQLIDAALMVTGFSLLSAQELAEVVLRAGGGHREAGPLQGTLTWLPETSLDDALKRLHALLTALPSSDVEALKIGDVETINASWILQALPECLLRAVQLTSREAQSVPDTLIDAGLLVQEMRNGGSEGDAIEELRLRIAKIPELRKQLTLAIARDEPHSFLNHLQDSRSLITFGPEMPGWLTELANAVSATPDEQHRWYEITRDIAIYFARGSLRRSALSTLINSPERAVREPDVLALRAARAQALRRFRQNEQGMRLREDERERKHTEIRKLLQERLHTQSATHCDLASLLAIMDALSARGVMFSVTRLEVDTVTRAFGAAIAAIFDRGLRDAWRTMRICDPRSFDESTRWEAVLGAASIEHAIRHGLSVHATSDEEATRAIQLSVWSDDGPGPWMAELGASRPHVVWEALVHWFEAEIAASSDEAFRNGQTIHKIIQADDSVRRGFLLHAASLMRSGRVPSSKLRRQFAEAMLGLAAPPLEEIVQLALKEINVDPEAFLCLERAECKAVAEQNLELAKQLEEIRLMILGYAQTSFDADWFSVLVRANFVAGMDWVKHRLDARGEELLEKTAASMADVDWARRLTGTSQEVRCLLWLFQQLAPLLPGRPDPVKESAGLLDPVRQLVANIPQALARLPGFPAHQALSELTDDLELIADHSAAEAERRKLVAAEHLLHFGEIHTRDARSEAELFEQALARLEDICDGVENGPFSERDLFAAGTPEKTLQLWLASRLSETPQRRFTVHREAQVNLDNRPDIEISSHVGKVCIELKPLDRTHAPYTAKQLAGALETQLVRKYLRGNNSRHGILVLMRLEERRWAIPGGHREGTLDQLVAWLQSQADILKASIPGVEGLHVVAIDFVVPV